jgi:hypothetical protein
MITLGLGDAVEVEVFTPAGREWRSGTVCSVEGPDISVAFADHSRLTLHRGIKRRRPRKT